MSRSNSNDIDVVVLWVDGNDPKHHAKRLAAMGGNKSLMTEDVGGDTRYAAMGELRWMLTSVMKFMPWVRKIHIVTDNQVPVNEMQWVTEHFGQRIPIQIVDHSCVFAGLQEALPTFNGISIESVVWRLPGLSRKYIYFNDDMIAVRHMTPDDWFDGEKLIVHGYRFGLKTARLRQLMKCIVKGRNVQGFKTPMIKTAQLLGDNHFIYYYHSPLPQDKELLKRYFTEHPEVLQRNVMYKFRDISQFTAQTLCTQLAEHEGRLILNSMKNNMLLKPVASRPDYLKEHLKRVDSNPNIKMVCINSLDCTTAEERDRFARWIEDVLGVRH